MPKKASANKQLVIKNRAISNYGGGNGGGTTNDDNLETKGGKKKTKSGATNLNSKEYFQKHTK